jgi:hypothetical protein
LSEIFLILRSIPEEIRVNTMINIVFKLNGEEIKRSPDFCYLGSVVVEDGGAKSDVNVRI